MEVETRDDMGVERGASREKWHRRKAQYQETLRAVERLQGDVRQRDESVQRLERMVSLQQSVLEKREAEIRSLEAALEESRRSSESAKRLLEDYARSLKREADREREQHQQEIERLLAQVERNQMRQQQIRRRPQSAFCSYETFPSYPTTMRYPPTVMPSCHIYPVQVVPSDQSIFNYYQRFGGCTPFHAGTSSSVPPLDLASGIGRRPPSQLHLPTEKPSSVPPPPEASKGPLLDRLPHLSSPIELQEREETPTHAAANDSSLASLDSSDLTLEPYRPPTDSCVSPSKAPAVAKTSTPGLKGALSPSSPSTRGSQKLTPLSSGPRGLPSASPHRSPPLPSPLAQHQGLGLSRSPSPFAPEPLSSQGTTPPQQQQQHSPSPRHSESSSDLFLDLDSSSEHPLMTTPISRGSQQRTPSLDRSGVKSSDLLQPTGGKAMAPRGSADLKSSGKEEGPQEEAPVSSSHSSELFLDASSDYF